MMWYKNRQSSELTTLFVSFSQVPEDVQTDKTRTCQKKKKTYKYVPEIVERIVSMQLDDEQSLYRRAECGEHDPRNIVSNIMNTRSCTINL